jgi:hypothetical protein
MRIPNKNEQALLGFLGCNQWEVKRFTPTVYGWNGKYLEILSVEQLKRGKVSASWYMKWDDWRIREMGKQSTIVKKILKKWKE